VRHTIHVVELPDEPESRRYDADIFVDGLCASGRSGPTAELAARLAVADLLRRFATEIENGKRPPGESIQFETLLNGRVLAVWPTGRTEQKE
jgi:hypothetical protein